MKKKNPQGNKDITTKPNKQGWEGEALDMDTKTFPGELGVGVVGLAENKATQPSFAGPWIELDYIKAKNICIASQTCS